MNIHKLTIKKSQLGGRNNQGRITVFHRGGGNRKMCRIIDYKRSLFNIPAIVLKFEYGYCQNSKILLILYKNGMLSYIIAPASVASGDIICAGPLVELSIGNALQLYNVPVGVAIHNIELKPGKGGQIMRAAGTWAKIIRHKNDSRAIEKKQSESYKRVMVTLRLCSGKIYNLSTQSMATLGIVAKYNPNVPFRLFKAGESRWINRRPIVRGVAMNPIDHPHGGGEGRSKGGRHPMTPWGKLTKGWKRRKNHGKL